MMSPTTKPGEGRHERLLQLLRGGVIEVDDQARVVFMNSAAREFFGADPPLRFGEQRPEDFAALVSALEPESARAILRASAAKLEPFTEPLAIRRELATGATLHLQIEATALVDSERDQKTTGLVYLITDVSARASAEKRQRELQKLEALAQLAAGVAHDFNNALHTILANTEAISTRIEEPRSKAALQEIARSVGRAQDVVAQILAFGRGADEPSEPLAVHDWLKQLVPLIRSALPPTIELIVHAPEPCEVALGGSELSQVLLNLVSNARQAIESGGTIELKIEASEAHVSLEVRDDGAGMSSEIQARIFEPYFSTKSPHEGSGLGMSVVHGIITGIGGQIEVESELGVGTVVRVQLPRADGLRSAPAPASEPASEPAQTQPGRETVFVLDDEWAGLDSMQALLEHRGYAVEVFTEPRTLVASFTQEPGRVDILLTDQLMPEMTGIEVARALWRRRPELPVVICTGTVESAAELGADPRVRIVAKPTSVRELARALREQLDARDRDTES